MDHNQESTTMTEPGAQSDLQRFHATSGRFSGYVGLAGAAVVLVLALRSWDADAAPAVAIGALLGAALVWVTLLRPAVWVTPRDLVLRGMFHTDHIPLGAIGRVAVGQVLAVHVAGKRYASPVVGYSARQTLRTTRARDKPRPTATDTYQVYVEERIAHLAQEHRELHGGADESVRRTWAWPEIAAVTLLAAGLVVALALR